MFQTYDAPPEGAQAEHRQRISHLRKQLAAKKLTAYVVPRADQHQGEYVAPCDERLSWLTGFTGSAGFAVIAQDKAALFVDGRYTLQARTQVPNDLITIETLEADALATWCKAELPPSAVIGFDPMLMTQAAFARTERALGNDGRVLKPVVGNLVDRVWGRERPAEPSAPVRPHKLQHAGQSAPQKVARIQEILREQGCDATILTQPDSIAWLLNIRGADVAHNPVVLAFAVVPVAGPVELFT
ncbi:MAG: aminopeptidase P family N-terminal domain-containing protein, partial [Pseudomonadota bacterium]